MIHLLITKKVLTELESHLLGPDFERERKTRAINLKREDCDSMADYYSKKVALLTKAFDKSKELILDTFIDGLSLEIRSWILKEKTEDRDTIEKVKILATRYDQILAAKINEDSVNVARLDEATSKIEKLEKELNAVKGNSYPKKKKFNSGYNRKCFACGSNSHDHPKNPDCPKHDPSRLRSNKPENTDKYDKTEKTDKTEQKQQSNRNHSIRCFWCNGIGHRAEVCASRLGGAPKQPPPKEIKY